jgi:chitin disaccharide deacetylase
MKKRAGLILLLLTGFYMTGCSKSETLTLNQRLGYENDNVLIIINADDIGMIPELTDANIKALIDGIVTSGSILIPASDADRALSILKNYPELSIGVHLTLTGGWPPLTPKGIAPGLYNEKGNMWDTMDEVLLHVKASEAEMEWDAQIRKALNSGVKITHLDGHMGCYLMSPDFFAKALELSKKYKIPLISPYIPDFVSKDDRKYLLISDYTGIYTIYGKEESFENRVNAYSKLLENLKPGIHYIYSHLADKNSAVESVLGDYQLRINDMKFFREKASGILEDRGYHTISCKNLYEEYQNLF